MTALKADRRWGAAFLSFVSSRSWLPWLFKLLVSSLLLALIIPSIDRTLFWDAFRSVDRSWLFVAILLFLPGQLFAAYRWYFLLGKLRRTLPFVSVFRYHMLGQLAAAFLPGQISGDIVRTMAIARGQSENEILALSVLIDRLALLVAICVSAAFGILLAPPLARLNGLAYSALSLGVIALAGILMLCCYRSDRVAHWLSILRFRFPRWTQAIFAKAAAILCSSRITLSTVIATLLLAFALQLINTFGGLVFAYAMHIAVNPIDWFAITAIVSIVQILPFSMGGLGLREGAFAGLLSLYAVPVAQSTAFSLAGFAVTLILVMIVWIAMERLAAKF